MATATRWFQRHPANPSSQSMKRSASGSGSGALVSCNGQGLRLVHPKVDFCIAVLFVVVVIYGFGVAIQKTADQGAARKVFDTLVRETCTHPVAGCRVT
jgi:hypothetical protein